MSLLDTLQPRHIEPVGARLMKRMAEEPQPKQPKVSDEERRRIHALQMRIRRQRERAEK